MKKHKVSITYSAIRMEIEGEEYSRVFAPDTNEGRARWYPVVEKVTGFGQGRQLSIAQAEPLEEEFQFWQSQTAWAPEYFEEVGK